MEKLQSSQSRWPGIFLGALVGISSFLGLTLLGVGIGLLVLPLEPATGEWVGFGLGASAYLALSLVGSQFVAGFISSRLYEPHVKGDSCYQGLGVWGVSNVLILALWAGTVANGTGKLLTTASLGTGTLVALDELSRLKPRIVTDMSLLKGKAVTTFDLGQLDSASLAKVAKSELKKESRVNKEALETVKELASAVSLAAFFGIALSCLGCTAGSVLSRRRSSR